MAPLPLRWPTQRLPCPALSQEQVLYTCGTAERLVSLAASASGNQLLGGSASGKCYLWAVGTGALLAVWQAHYKPVSAVSFAEGDSFLYTGGEDANVHVWRAVE